MNSRTLHHFLLLADHLHFGQASAVANVSVSALSRNIRQLEEELGTSLFHRNNRNVTLTLKGTLFKRYAKQAHADWAQIRNQLADDGTTLRGQISLYCSVTASHSLLSTLLNRFRPDYPSIDIKLHTGDPEDALKRVTSLSEDIAIAAKPDRLLKSLIFKSIAESPLVFIASRKETDFTLPNDTNNNKANNKGRNQDHWSQVPMILSERGVARQRVNQWFKQEGITPQIYAQVTGNEAIVSMVSLGLGVGVVPQIVLENSSIAHEVRTLNIKHQLAPYQLGLCTLKKNLENPLVAAFWATAK